MKKNSWWYCHRKTRNTVQKNLVKGTKNICEPDSKVVFLIRDKSNSDLEKKIRSLNNQRDGLVRFFEREKKGIYSEISTN